MSKPLYDAGGAVVGFLLTGGRIINPAGASIYWVQQKTGNVYDYTGNHKGWWEGDHLIGAEGGVLVWMRGARLPVLASLPSLPPLAPLPSLEPLRPLPSLPPLKPLKAMSWSDEPWGDE